MKRWALFLALTLGAWGQLPDNELLRNGQPEAVLAGETGALDWAEAMLLLDLYYLKPDQVLSQLRTLPDSPEVLLVRGRLHWGSPEGREELLQAYARSQGITRIRAAAVLAASESKSGHQKEALELLSEALHEAQKVDQSWLDYEVAWASSQIYSQKTPDQREWGSLLQLRQRCRQRQDWFWAARAGMAIYGQIRSQPDWQRTVEYALGAFDDAEKAGSRLYLWSAVQHFATGIGKAPQEQVAPLLAARAVDNPYAFAYLSGLRWLRWNDPEVWDSPLAAARNDWEVYEARKNRIRFRPTREDLETVHAYEVAHSGQRTFTAFNNHLAESNFHQKLGELETDAAARAPRLWQAWTSSGQMRPVERYNLMLELSRRFEADGRLVDLFRARLIQYQHVLSQADPLHYATILYDSGQTGAAALSSDWSEFLAESVRLDLAAQFEAFEQGILDKIDQTSSLSEQSSLYGRLDDLFTFQKRPLEALEAARCKVDGRPDESWIHRDLALALIRAGQDEEAVEQLKEALALESRGNGFEEEVFHLSMQAGCLIRLKRLQEAEQALTQAEAQLAGRKWGQESLEAQRSNLLRAQKRWAELEALYRVRIAKAPPLTRFRLLLGLAELQVQQSQDPYPTFAQAEKLADEMGGGAPARLWLARPEPRLLEKARRQLQEMADLVPEKDRPRFLQQPAVAAVMRGEGLTKEPTAPGLTGMSKPEFLLATAVLRQRSPQWEQLSPVTVPALLEVQPRLAANEVFLSFTSLPHQVVVVGCNRQQFFLHTAFFERDRLEGQIAQLRQALSRPGGHYQPSARRLYNNLITPLQACSEGKQVWLAAQGQLLNLPWPALQDSQGKFLVEHWAGHKLWWGLSQQPRGPIRVGQALLVAAPGQSQLEGVIPEVRAIQKQLPGSRTLLAGQATRANLLRWLPQSDWLHLAAHSKFNRTALQNSYVELSDGPLPLSQLYRLKLRPHTTVILSSCQTAQGQPQPGKDLLSLGSGFRLSGAAQVLATLWPVDDQASVEFFTSTPNSAKESPSLPPSTPPAASS